MRPQAERTGGGRGGGTGDRGWDRVPVAARIAFFVTLGLAGVLRIGAMLPDRTRGLDFSHYYTTSRLLIEGRDPYAADLRGAADRLGLDLEGVVPGATNPPPLVVLLAPLAVLPPGTAHAIWSAFQAVCLLVTLLLVGNLARLGRHGTLYLAGAVLFSYALYAHFWYGQVQLLIGVLLLGALRLEIADRPLAAALLVTGAGLLKLFPFLLLPWFVWRATPARKRGPAAAAAAGLTLVVVVAQWPLWRSFVAHAPGPIAATVAGLTFNFSLPSLLVRAGAPLAVAGPAGLLLIAAGYLACPRNSGSDQRVIEAALLLSVLVAATATGWGHYFVLLILPFALFARDQLAVPEPRRILLVVLVYALVLFLLHLPGVHGGPLLGLAVAPLYGLLGLAWHLAGRARAG